MSIHTKPLSIKWGFTIIILLSLLPVFESLTLGQLTLLSIVLVGVTYLAVDLVLLPMFGMLAAAIVDFGISFLTVWLFTSLFLGQSTAVVIASPAVAYFFVLCEALFHGYLNERILTNKRAIIIPFPTTTNYQTEASDEIYPNDKEEKD